jgi:hypothetical protein
MKSYPSIDTASWSARITRWNARTGRNYTHRKMAADECRTKGHDYRESPVGAWCYCCCQYFRREGE